MALTYMVNHETIEIDYELRDNAGSFADPGGGDTLRIVFERYSDGSSASYLFGSDPEITKLGVGRYRFTSQTGSGVLVSSTVRDQFDYEWQVDGTITDRERGEFMLIADL